MPLNRATVSSLSRLTCLAVAGLLVPPAAAQRGGAPEDDGGRAVLAAIESPLAVELTNTPFIDALRWWSRSTDVPMVVDWEEMELQGVDRKAPVTLQLEGVPAGTVLILMLDAASPPDVRDAQMFAEVHNQFVLVMTKGEADRNPYTVVYDCAEDVLPTYDHFRDAPSFDLDDALSDNTGGGGGGGGGLFEEDNNSGDDREQQRIDSGEDLATLIREVVEPELWVANGGDVARCVYRRNRLIIRAPSYVHDQIPLAPIVTGGE